MKSKAVQFLRVPSLLLAAALQVLPIVRVALPAAETAANVLAIIFRWVACAAALGAVDAVSAASTVITSPLAVTIPQGSPYTLRLTTAPNQAHYWTATGLPAGLSLSGTSGSVSWSLTGTPTVSGTFNVALTAKDSANSGPSLSTSSTLVLTVTPGASPPAISSSPASLTVTQSQSATFSVTATGTATLGYQWRFNGANLSGQTATSLVINPATTNNAGNYDVVVANSVGSVTSAVATLTVIVPATAPTIATPPSSLTVTQNQSATFSAAANGTAPLNYQWRFMGANLSGQSAATLVINPATTNNAGNYDVVVANGAGSVTSAVATLTVIVPVIAPSITSQPVSLTVTQSQSASFSVAAGGTAPFSYQWRFKGANLSGQTALNLLINPATTNNAGGYDVVVANSAGSVTSSVANLTVVVPGTALQITSQPASLTVTQNQSATLSVSAAGSGTLGYQWRFKGVNLSGQTATNLVINPVTTNNAGNYDVLVSNGSGSVTSAVATLTVIVPAIAPAIASQPVSLTVTQGFSAGFSVTANGTAPLSYQWRFQGSNLTGQTAASLAINPATTNNAGGYDVVIANSAGSVTSLVATLTVIPPPPVLALLTVQIRGSGTVNPSYNGQLLQVGATYTITATAAAGYSFSNWTGSLSANTLALTFVMRSNLVLQANFISDTVTLVKGTYHGLFAQDTGTALPTSGAIVLTTTALGKYSGALMMVGQRYPFAGQFNLSGHATNLVARAKLPALTVELALDKADTDHLGGRVTDGTWSAPIEADRAVFDAKTNPAPEVGTYTIVIPGTKGDPTVPAGDSFGTLKVDAAGNLAFSGQLAEGTKVTHSTTISKNGDWPFYSALYSGAGSILGWLQFTNTSTDDISGRVVWIRWQQPSAKSYPLGFTSSSAARASKYVKPAAGQAVLGFSTGSIQISDGGLTNGVSGPILLGLNNKISGLNGIKASLTVTPTSGAFTGSFVDPATAKTIPVQGVVLQKQNAGGGFFLGSNLSGEIRVGP